MLLTMEQTEQIVYVLISKKVAVTIAVVMLLMFIPVLCMKQAGSFLNSADVEDALGCLWLFKITHGFSVLRSIHVK